MHIAFDLPAGSGAIALVHHALSLGAALMAGVFFAFSVFVMAALDDRPAADAVGTMQRINVRVLNRCFLGVFFGVAVVSALAMASLFRDRPVHNAASTGVAAAAYLLGVFGVTVLGNVPLNRALAALEPGAADAADQWRRYRVAWTKLNHVRTIAAAASATLWSLGAPPLVLLVKTNDRSRWASCRRTRAAASRGAGRESPARSAPFRLADMANTGDDPAVDPRTRTALHLGMKGRWIGVTWGLMETETAT